MDAISNLIGIMVTVFVAIGLGFGALVVAYVVAKRKYAMRGD